MLRSWFWLHFNAKGNNWMLITWSLPTVKTAAPSGITSLQMQLSTGSKTTLNKRLFCPALCLQMHPVSLLPLQSGKQQDILLNACRVCLLFIRKQCKQGHPALPLPCLLLCIEHWSVPKPAGPGSAPGPPPSWTHLKHLTRVRCWCTSEFLLCPFHPWSHSFGSCERLLFTTPLHCLHH